ncbi:MAG TPA: peptidoglycan editing factor PgeF [Anaerolineales bacterium]|nr:peptidoglycan editing factor PgeF [Anaerolineales bacterium]HNH26620.1 peptidoglycan editing factor PgeF [Anaerolineales bacterium]
MPFDQSDGLRYYQFDIFSKNILNAVFTRQGGISPEPWTSLNLSISVGDDPARVAENRVHAFNALGRNPASIHDAWLIHGTDVIFADAPRSLDAPTQKADILFTDNPEVSLFMRFADCVPLLFHDPKKNVIGISHAGWMGTVKGVAEVSVQAMQERYGSNPQDIVVGIGPSISADHYEVGEDVAAQFREKYGKDSEQVVQVRDEKIYLDLWAANALQLQKMGVEHIQISGLCTACHLDDWYSHRAEKGKTGRFGVLLAMV